jgi:hypothetical protein
VLGSDLGLISVPTRILPGLTQENREAHENSQSLGRDSNWLSSENKTEALPLETQRSIRSSVASNGNRK